ncbi:hypothetical protein DVA67_011210 [Solirubrobacter sp. CPCC 204708]|uniref:Virginiamycin B lyase n=1 Tax=Solirubrobacter deserti TaxID=2282478 RepID=A0ABT4RIB8_9ACTN|nr:hypothetical protein [Solirubrobacter deserti]MBE2316547.1 hypothetical protein [Solirubrobacter deserti]MDA0138081.1 hypothetical protein [Solirubrobacter deserti]
MRWVVSLLACAGAVLALPQMAAAQRVQPVAGLADVPDAIVAGPDGAMWATLPADPGRVVRMTPAGAVSYAATGGLGGFPADRRPAALARHEGDLWFTLAGGSGSFARLGSAPLSLAYGRPTAFASGPDGALWMTVDAAPDAITRYTPGSGTEVTHPIVTENPRAIVAGADGALWFTAAPWLGRMTTDGAVSYRWVGAAPTAIAPGPRGSLWYAQSTTVASVHDPTPYAIGSPVGALAAGPDGALWGAARGAIARIVPGEAPTVISEGLDPAAQGVALAAGPDGRMWMGLDRPPYLVRVTVPPVVGEPTATGDAVSAPVNANGVEGRVSAERREADGTWRAFADAPLAGATAAVPARLPLTALGPGEHAVRVTATTSAGSASSEPLTVTRAAAPPAAPDGPVQGRSVAVGVLSGTVEYRVPPSTDYVRLTGSTVLPLGVVLDTEAGKVRVTAQVDGRSQSGDFDGGKFRVKQTATGMTELALAGPLSCTRSERASAAQGSKRKRKRSLWGSDRGGSFRTRGNGSVATVRGTRWRTQDTCAGTTVYVREGAVSVWPRRGGRSVLVRAGQRLFSPRPR